MKLSKIFVTSFFLIGMFIGFMEEYLPPKNTISYDSDIAVMEYGILAEINKLEKRKSLYEYYINNEIDLYCTKSWFVPTYGDSELKAKIYDKAKKQKLTEQEFNYICDFEIYNNNGNIQIWDKYMPTLAVEIINGKTVYYGMPEICRTRRNNPPSSFKNNY